MIERLGVNTDWAEEEQAGLCQVAQCGSRNIPGTRRIFRACCGAGEASGGSSPAPFRPRLRIAEGAGGTRPVDSDVAGRQVL